MKSIALLLLLLMPFRMFAQNLVPNPSFEDTVYCPFSTNQMDACLSWSSFGNTPEYWNECNPYAGFGFQLPRTGNGKAAFVAYRKPNSPNGPNYREFVGCHLLTQLQAGTKYYITFYVNFAYTNNVAVACNKLGCSFTNTQFTELNPPTINNISAIWSDSIITDSVQWFKISGSYTPTIDYDYFMIGNFFTDANTDTVVLSQFPDYSYYYLDDVCISTDSNYCETWTNVSHFNNEIRKFDLSPNPTSENLNIKANVNILHYEITNSMGTTMLSKGNILLSKFSISINQLKQGHYIIKLVTKDTTIYRKFIIKK